MLTSYLIGPPWPIKNQANAKLSIYKFIEDQVIRIKLKNHVPRQMRVRVRFCKVY